MRLISFYFLILIPLTTLGLLAKLNLLNSASFVTILFVYVFAYHPLICGLRLVTNQRLERKSFWKSFIPFWYFNNFSFLFFNK